MIFKDKATVSNNSKALTDNGLPKEINVKGVSRFEVKNTPITTLYVKLVEKLSIDQ
ncbi:MAG: hypothetical protein ACFFE8_04965 [Candidatus Heimdallarchaeota archaeon]